MNPVSPAGVTVVGIGADGWDGLAPAARAAVAGAAVVMGSPRQLALIPESVVAPELRELLPTPLAPVLAGLLDRDGLCVLASGDPMLHGIGASLARVAAPGRLRVLPAVSSISLAASRLGWTLPGVTVLSLVTADPASVLSALMPGGRLLVLARDGDTAPAVAGLLAERGWGASRITVLSELGGAGEAVTPYTCGGRTPELAVLAIEAAPAPGATVWPAGLALPDEAFATDGALTRREVRLVALAALRPGPGDLLWDVGAGSGSIAVSWLRTGAAGLRAVALEPRADRRALIEANARALGVPALRVVAGSAPAGLEHLEQPQAVFIGGGLTVPGVVDACWDALPSGGRIVATAVTIESETLLHATQARLGGQLTRLELSRSGALGSFTTWRPELPIVVWESMKP